MNGGDCERGDTGINGRERMKLNGIHHITAITADAQQNVDFYADLLGLRLVKKTVNFDAPDVYHLYYGDEVGNPGSILTFFEFPGVPLGRAGAGMVSRIAWRVTAEALDFWSERLRGAGIAVERAASSLRFVDPEGLELELAVDDGADEPLRANHPDIAPEHALRGFAGVRVHADLPRIDGGFLASLGFAPGDANLYSLAGDSRHAFYAYDACPPEERPERPLQGAGTVHHIALATPPEEHAAWRERVLEAGGFPTPIIDRQYFRSIYFREPSGVLFELATIGPGFTVDEPAETLGDALRLPPQYEHLREQLERRLTPLRNPRTAVGVS
ncbi:MAG: VOC family protein [Actinomycetota bacterium]|nr:VOC family protein [Actinomycetota bacterium]